MFPKITIYIFIFFIYLIKCPNYNCTDVSCMSCSSDGSYCFKCKPGFSRHYSKCGKKCSSIVNCNLCDITEKKCIRCKSNCVFNGKMCDCTERYILAVVCLFFSLFMLFIFFFCLTHKSFLRALSSFSYLSGRIAPSILNRTDITRNNYYNYNFNSTEIDNKIMELELEREFNQKKISVDKDIYKKKCYICKNNSCNLKLGCGCLICFECEKKCVRNNICLNCNKNITSMQQVSCSICYANKKEFSYFNCSCKNVVCKECFIKWRKQNNMCPFCRRTII